MAVAQVWPGCTGVAQVWHRCGTGGAQVAHRCGLGGGTGVAWAAHLEVRDPSQSKRHPGLGCCVRCAPRGGDALLLAQGQPVHSGRRLCTGTHLEALDQAQGVGTEVQGARIRRAVTAEDHEISGLAAERGRPHPASACGTQQRMQGPSVEVGACTRVNVCGGVCAWGAVCMCVCVGACVCTHVWVSLRVYTVCVCV